MSALVRHRQSLLRHHLDPADSATRADLWWLLTRTHAYAAAAGIAVDVVLDQRSYHHWTGRTVGDWCAGAAYTGPVGARWPVPLIYLSPRLLPTRGDAETVIAHEVMHARWPSYGHKKIAFARAQQLLDTVAAVA